jgi:hypothetical protein
MGIQTVIDAKGNKIRKWVQTEKNTYWKSQWVKAWDKMPRHSASLLCKLLGYRITSPSRYNTGNNRVFNNMRRGSKPRDPIKAVRLQALAGPYGLAFAKMLAIREGIEFK